MLAPQTSGGDLPESQLGFRDGLPRMPSYTSYSPSFPGHDGRALTVQCRDADSACGCMADTELGMYTHDDKCKQPWVLWVPEEVSQEYIWSHPLFSPLACSSFILEWTQSYLTDRCKGKYRRDCKSMTTGAKLITEKLEFELQFFSPSVWARDPVPATIPYNVICKVSACRVNLFGCYF